MTPDRIADRAGRFGLRRWRLDDVDELVAIWQDPVLTDRFPVPVPYTSDVAQAFVASVTRAWEQRLAFHLAIVAPDDPDTILGGCDLSDLGGSAADVGYWLAAAARGRGLATLVVAELVEWATTHLQSSEFVLEVEPDNLASIAVAERNGFHPDGTERHDEVRGRSRTLRRYRRP